VITIIPPKICPSCASDLIWVKDQLYCKNTSCPAQSSKKIEHFSKTLKIKGLGPASIKKLDLVEVWEIYLLTQEVIAYCLSSEKLAEKLILEIQNSEKVSLNRLLPAFSIPLVGKTASEKLAVVCTNLDNITEETCKLAGLGAKTTKNLMDWIYSNTFLIESLPFTFEFTKPIVRTEIRGTICISGRLKSFKTKALASSVLEELGYVIKSSLTKDVTILVNESGVESAKTKTATQRGITIVTNLKDFLGEI